MTQLESIKKLRSETGLSMSLIKEALEKTRNYDEAKAYLHAYRQEDKHDQVGKKGMVVAKIDGDTAILYEVNAMTDFVTTHQAFKAFVHDLGELLINNPKTSLDALHGLKMGNSTVEDKRIQLETIIGEHVQISRFESVIKSPTQHFGMYQHFNHKSSTIVVLEGGSQDHADIIAKQVTAIGALHPVWEKTVIDQILASTLFGKDISVGTYLNDVQSSLLYTSRYELGETMTEHLSCSLLSKEACNIA